MSRPITIADVNAARAEMYRSPLTSETPYHSSNTAGLGRAVRSVWFLDRGSRHYYMQGVVEPLGFPSYTAFIDEMARRRAPWGEVLRQINRAGRALGLVDDSYELDGLGGLAGLTPEGEAFDVDELLWLIGDSGRLYPGEVYGIAWDFRSTLARDGRLTGWQVSEDGTAVLLVDNYGNVWREVPVEVAAAVGKLEESFRDTFDQVWRDVYAAHHWAHNSDGELRWYPQGGQRAQAALGQLYAMLRRLGYDV